MLSFVKKLFSKDSTGKNSKEPWVNVIGEQIDPERGIKIELDWNPAFVEYLRNNGYKGDSEEAVVQYWLAHLYQQLMERMKTANSTPSDFI